MNKSCKHSCSTKMQILLHHIYELKKGIRNMVLHTMDNLEKRQAETLLKRKGICYVTIPVNERKINVFFGKSDCIKIIKSFGQKPLFEYTPEEDFILGVMLGYDCNQQCIRYLRRKYNLNSQFSVNSAYTKSIV